MVSSSQEDEQGQKEQPRAKDQVLDHLLSELQTEDKELNIDQLVVDFGSVGVQKSSSDLGGEVQHRNGEGPNSFGEVQLLNHQETENDKTQRLASQQRQDEGIKKNSLVWACEQALKIDYSAHSILEAREYSVESLAAFTLEMGSTRGYLVFSTSHKEDLDRAKLEAFKKRVTEGLEVQRQPGILTGPFHLDIEVRAYDQVIVKFSEFNLSYETPSGNHINVAFVSRQFTEPVFYESDREDMFLVDMKSIPPQTTVNFEAFIYLPKNKRFVRYLKKGGHLTLKQVKRHSSQEVNGKKGHIYLPKEQKDEFISFYIKNTLSWEFHVNSLEETSSNS